MAVGRRLGDDVGTYRAARAAAVIDDDRLAQRFAQANRDDARDDVVGAPWCERHHQAYGLGRILLG